MAGYTSVQHMQDQMFYMLYNINSLFWFLYALSMRLLFPNWFCKGALTINDQLVLQMPLRNISLHLRHSAPLSSSWTNVCYHSTISMSTRSNVNTLPSNFSASNLLLINTNMKLKWHEILARWNHLRFHHITHLPVGTTAAAAAGIEILHKNGIGVRLLRRGAMARHKTASQS